MGRSADLADQFEQAIANFGAAIESHPDDKWNATSEEGWTVAATAQHVSGQFPLEMEYITAAAEGQGSTGLRLGRHQRPERQARCGQYRRDEITDPRRTQGSRRVDCGLHPRSERRTVGLHAETSRSPVALPSVPSN